MTAAGAPSQDDAEFSAEPDYRFTLANERTFLAWVRTALGLLAAAVAAARLLPTGAVPAAGHLVGVLLVALAAVVLGAGLARWRAVERAMRAGGALPRTRLPWMLTIGLGAVCALAVVVVLTGTTAT